MKDIYIKNLKINKIRHLENISIHIGSDFKHLILTGPNGSGKTSVLKFLSEVIKKQQERFPDIRKPALIKKLGKNVEETQTILSKIIREPGESINITFSKEEIEVYKKCIFVFLPSKRYDIKESETFREMQVSTDTRYLIEKALGEDYIDYMKYLHFYMHSTDAIEYTSEKINIKKWFNLVEKILKEIYHDEGLELSFAPELWTFKIETKGRLPFTLNEMADGHSAYFKLIMEIMVRFHFRLDKPFDPKVSGIVLIDEIDIHLHVEMQKDILPLLTRVFPNIQFIVTTHSPFVISSSVDATVFDLENKSYIENSYLYSYQAVIEEHFDIGMYSKYITKRFNEYRDLYKKEHLTNDEKIIITELAEELMETPQASREIYFAIMEMENERKSRKTQ